MSRPPAPRLAIAAALAVAVSVSACDRREVEASARALADDVFPGELDFRDSAWRPKEGGYRVEFGVRGDPVARVAFMMSGAGKCRGADSCEAALRRARDIGLFQAAELKALDRGFLSCGVSVLEASGFTGQRGRDGSVLTGGRATVALTLSDEGRAEALARLKRCAEAWGRERRTAGGEPPPARLEVSIVAPGDGFEPPAGPLTLERKAPSKLLDRPLHRVAVSFAGKEARLGPLVISLPWKLRQEMDGSLVEAARRFLAGRDDVGAGEPLEFSMMTMLDPARLDVVRAYVLACTKAGAPGRRCVADIAVRLRYDISSAVVDEATLIPDVRDGSGRLVLPRLDGG